MAEENKPTAPAPEQAPAAPAAPTAAPTAAAGEELKYVLCQPSVHTGKKGTEADELTDLFPPPCPIPLFQPRWHALVGQAKA